MYCMGGAAIGGENTIDRGLRGVEAERVEK
jgi:hypothetical protein